MTAQPHEGSAAEAALTRLLAELSPGYGTSRRQRAHRPLLTIVPPPGIQVECAPPDTGSATACLRGNAADSDGSGVQDGPVVRGGGAVTAGADVDERSRGSEGPVTSGDADASDVSDGSESPVTSGAADASDVSDGSVGPVITGGAAVTCGDLDYPPADDAMGLLFRIAAQRSRLDAELLHATREVVARVGESLLQDKGFTSVEELSAGLRRKWRAETKRLTCAEIQVSLGVGIVEARHLVGLASAPLPVRDVVEGALHRGWASLGHARRFWERCGSLEAEEAGQIAEGLFGASVETAVAERLAPDGTLLDRPWHHAEFMAALEREAVRVEGQDVVAERERRRLAREQRHVRLRVDDDSTATLAVVGPLPGMSAITMRLDAAARNLRKDGDDRTLSQLRSDVAQTLLLHGTVDLPDLGDDELLTPSAAERITAVVNALPAVQLQVVVPWSTLGSPTTQRVGEETTQCTTVAETAQGTTVAETAQGTTVAEILGRHHAFISPGEARELALAPGTTLCRLLVDPADGRLIERSLGSYRPDADMRRQVIAADVYSRAPGSRSPAPSGEIDHVVPWPGGATSETNLHLLDLPTHKRKTIGSWRCSLAPNRDVTWQTILGRIERTRSHDYRQYLLRAVAAAQGPSQQDQQDQQESVGETHDHLGGVTQTHDQLLDLASRALYAALSHRGPSGLLRDPDDLDGAVEHDPSLRGWISLSYRGNDGQIRGSGAPDQPTVAELLGLPTDPSASTRKQSEGKSARTQSEGTSAQEPADPRLDPPPF